MCAPFQAVYTDNATLKLRMQAASADIGGIEGNTMANPAAGARAKLELVRLANIKANAAAAAT